MLSRKQQAVLNPLWRYRRSTNLWVSKRNKSVERDAILDYQRQLDEPWEALENGEIMQAELNDLQSRLAKDLPEAVRAKLPTDHPQAPVTQVAEATSPTPSTPGISALQGFSVPSPGG